MSLNVIIIGGAIGGLTLAHGLRRAGVSVAVYERDHTRTERLQGYRIHISLQGCRAFHECPPAHLYRRFVDTSGKPNTSLGFYDERLRKLLVVGDETPVVDAYVDSYKSVNKVVKTALRNLRSGVNDGVAARFMTKAVFRVINRVGPIRRKMAEAMTR